MWKKLENLLRKYISALILVSCFVCGCIFSSCGKEAEKEEAAEWSGKAELEFFAMDTFMKVTAYGEEELANAAAKAAQEEIYRLEALLSTGLETSEIAQVNAAGSGAVSADTLYLLKRAKELCELTGGVFDISVYPLVRAWGFTKKEYRVPAQEEIEALLEKTDAMRIVLDEEDGRAAFGIDGMQVDLGGIAKGYASARIMELYREMGIKSGLVSLGGNVQALGAKPDGSPWRIALQDPEDKEQYLGILQVKDRAVITSGSYERYFEQDGVRYHHILDPATGYPAESGLLSVTIVSADGTLADGFATSLFIMGKERAVQFWREHAEEFDAVLYTEEGELFVTEGIADDFSTEKPVQVVTGKP